MIRTMEYFKMRSKKRHGRPKTFFLIKYGDVQTVPHIATKRCITCTGIGDFCSSNNPGQNCGDSSGPNPRLSQCQNEYQDV